MNVVPKNLPILNNSIAYPLIKVIITMLLSGLIIGIVARIIFFWAPRSIRNYLVQIASGLGIILGLYLAFVIFKF